MFIERSGFRMSKWFMDLCLYPWAIFVEGDPFNMDLDLILNNIYIKTTLSARANYCNYIIRTANLFISGFIYIDLFLTLRNPFTNPSKR